MNSLNDWILLGMFLILVVVVLNTRRASARAEARRIEQYAHFELAQNKVLETLAATEQTLATTREILAATEKFLKEQQRANRILEHQNAALARQIGEIQAKLEAVEARLEVVTAELKEVRAELKSMTRRAEVAEDHIDAIE